MINHRQTRKHRNIHSAREDFTIREGRCERCKSLIIKPSHRQGYPRRHPRNSEGQILEILGAKRTWITALGRGLPENVTIQRSPPSLVNTIQMQLEGQLNPMWRILESFWDGMIGSRAMQVLATFVIQVLNLLCALVGRLYRLLEFESRVRVHEFWVSGATINAKNYYVRSKAQHYTF